MAKRTNLTMARAKKPLKGTKAEGKGDNETTEKTVRRSHRLHQPSILSLPLIRSLVRFFDAPCGESGLKYAGIIRILFALLFLYDRILLGFQLDFFYGVYDENGIGVLPPLSSRGEIGRSELDQGPWFNLFDILEEYDGFMVKMLYGFGIFHAVCLLYGVYSRFNAFCIYVNIVSFQNRGVNMMFDKQDDLMLLVSFYLIFLPLSYKYTAIDLGLKQPSKSSSSYPRMWPFRLLQIQTACLFTGVGHAKLVSDIWWPSGMAMYFLVHQQDFFGGFFTPESIFHRVGPLKLLTLTSLGLETSCWFLVWIPKLKRPVVYAMILFHLAIEAAMNIHVFQWLSIVCWLSFLVEPEDIQKTITAEEDEDDDDESYTSKDQSVDNHDHSDDMDFDDEASEVSATDHKPTNWSLRRTMSLVLNVLFPLAIASCTFLTTFPITDGVYYALLPFYGFDSERVETIVESHQVRLRHHNVRQQIHSLLRPLDIQQDPWWMYGQFARQNVRIVAKIQFKSPNPDSDDESGSDEDYFSSPQWSTMSTMEKKMLYRQVLFWSNLHWEPDVQYEVCRQLGRRAVLEQRKEVKESNWEDEIDHVALMQISTGMPGPYNEWASNSIESMKEWFWDPISPLEYFDWYDERLLYVYQPSLDKGTTSSILEGVATTNEYGFNYARMFHGEDEETEVGIWWDKQFYQYDAFEDEYYRMEYDKFLESMSQKEAEKEAQREAQQMYRNSMMFDEEDYDDDEEMDVSVTEL